MPARLGFRLRCHRARFWIDRAETLFTTGDHRTKVKSLLDEQFIFLWIALNALYGQAKYRQDEVANTSELTDFFRFLSRASVNWM
jgi:hypothetical protein